MFYAQTKVHSVIFLQQVSSEVRKKCKKSFVILNSSRLCIFTGNPDKNTEFFLCHVGVCVDVGEKREMSHVSLVCMCGNDPGSMSNCGGAREGQRLWRGTNARENKL